MVWLGVNLSLLSNMCLACSVACHKHCKDRLSVECKKKSKSVNDQPETSQQPRNFSFTLPRSFKRSSLPPGISTCKLNFVKMQVNCKIINMLYSPNLCNGFASPLHNLEFTDRTHLFTNNLKYDQTFYWKSRQLILNHLCKVHRRFVDAGGQIYIVFCISCLRAASRAHSSEL